MSFPVALDFDIWDCYFRHPCDRVSQNLHEVSITNTLWYDLLIFQRSVILGFFLVFGFCLFVFFFCNSVKFQNFFLLKQSILNTWSVCMQIIALTWAKFWGYHTMQEFWIHKLSVLNEEFRKLQSYAGLENS